MYGDGFKAMAEALRALAILCFVAMPLALWKAVEIVIWFFSHIRWEL